MAKKGAKKKRGGEPKDFWFRKRKGAASGEAGWGWIPVNWKGWLALIVLVGVNVFAAQYFDLVNAGFKQGSSFGIVFLLSLFVFIVIAQRKTKGVKVKK